MSCFGLYCCFSSIILFPLSFSHFVQFAGGAKRLNRSRLLSFMFFALGLNNCRSCHSVPENKHSGKRNAKTCYFLNWLKWKYVEFKKYILHVKLTVYYTVSFTCNIYFLNPTYSRLSLSRSRRDPLKHFEISVLRHIRFAELRKIPTEQSNFTNEHVIWLL